jgi:alpha-beta hydrolase superfamily lysophospholipase
MSSTPPPLRALSRRQQRLQSKHGHTCALHAWEAPERPHACVLLAHGYSNYLGPFFDWLAAQFSLLGVQCVGLEFYGHGQSDGLPGFCPSFEAYVDDLLAAAETARRELCPGLPLFCYG